MYNVQNTASTIERLDGPGGERIDQEEAMKKARIRKLDLHRETLRRLISDDLTGVRGGRDSGEDWCSVPSCIDGCPSAMCPPSILPEG